MYFNLIKIPESQLNNAEKLKLKIAESTIKEYNIPDKQYADKINLVIDDFDLKIKELENKFKSVAKKLNEYTFISKGYHEIIQKDYITKLIEEKRNKKQLKDNQQKI